jgi:hypothetical protein
VTYAEIEAEWVVICEEAKIRIEQLYGLAGQF